MKNILRLMMFFAFIIILSISSKVFAESSENLSNEIAEDIVTKFSDNFIKVDLIDEGTKIRFSYCEDKNKLDKCELLGHGQYLVEDLKQFKTIQGVKLAGNSVGAILGVVVGGVAVVAGSVGTSTLVFAPAGLAVGGVGIGLVAGGVKLTKFAVNNIENLYVLDSDLWIDKTIDFGLDFSLKLKKYSKDTFKNREEKKKIILKRNDYNKQLIKTTAVEIEKILFRLDVSVKE